MHYRKIYENHFGAIPVDEFGVTYDIHHIDGNRKNNDPSNLKAVSLEEHYEIHYEQGDYAACALILERLMADIQERKKLQSELSRQNCLKMVAEGRHPFSGGDIQRKSNAKRISEGTHNFTSELAKNRWTSGKHPLDGLIKRRTEEGTNHFCIRHTCEHCGKAVDGGNYRRWHGDKCKSKES